MKKIAFYILLSVLGAHAIGQVIPRPNIEAPAGLQVNSFTGNLFYQRNELMVRGKGFSVHSMFYYNSAGDTLDYGYGKGWSFNYHMFYRFKGDTVILQKGDTKKDTFLFQSGAYHSPVGVFDTLIKTGNVFTLETKNKIRYIFADETSKKITSWTDPNGNFLSFTYDGNNLSKISSTSGKYLRLIWENGHLQSITDSNTTVKKYSYLYDVKDDLVSVTDPLGNTRQFSYDKHKLISVVDENNNPIIITYSPSGKVKKIISCNSAQQFTFLAAQRRTFVSETAAAGNIVTSYEFDAQGRLASFTNPLRNSITFMYDDDNNLKVWSDFNNNTSFYDYDAKGNMIKETDAKGNVKQFTYETNFNKVASIKDQKGNITGFLYDIKGNLNTVQYPDGSSETFQYDANGQVISYTDQRNNSTGFVYNGDGQLITINYPIGTQSIEYNGSCCSATKITDPNGNTIETVYDKLNRPLSIKDGLNHTITYEYDAAGNRIKETDPNGISKTYGYDALNRLIRVTLPAGAWHYEYDGKNNMVSMTDANGNITYYSYDNNSRLVSERDPLGNTTTYIYDANSNLVSKKTTNGNTISYKYDADNRLTEKSYEGNIDKYAYDGNGNLVSAYNNNIAYTFTYDDLNRLLKKNIINWNKSIAYTYDVAGNRLTMTDHDGGLTQYSYDANNRLTALTDPSNLITGFTYDAGGRLLQQNNPNNTYATWHYDLSGRIDNIENRRTNGDTISFFKYTFDNYYNRRTMQDKYGLHLYNYDSSYRLVKVVYPNASVDSFIIGATGNREQRIQNSIPTSYSYNAADQLISAGPSTFTFDANGNMTQQADSLLRKYEYDGENRLNEVLIGQKKVEYRYDPFGDKIERVDTNNVVTKMIYDGNNLLGELSNVNSTITQYTSSVGADSWVSMKTNGSMYYYHKDGLNSVNEVTGMSGLLSNEYQFDIFGSIRSQSVNVSNKILFAGRVMDADGGLYDYKARLYKPELGIFITKDKFEGFIDNPLSFNKYTYVESDPVNFIDRTGYSVWSTVTSTVSGYVNSATKAVRNSIVKYGAITIATEVARAVGTAYGGPLGGVAAAAAAGGLIGVGESVYNHFFETPEENRCWKGLWEDIKVNGSIGAISAVVPVGKGVAAVAKYTSKGGRAVVDFMPKVAEQVGGYVGDQGISGGKAVYDYFKDDPCKEPPSPDEPPSGPNEPPTGPGVDDPTTGGFPIFVPIRRGGDPNEIIGPAGYDTTKKWVSVNSRLPYKILFENDPKIATAPAQKVMIYLPIDTKLNPASLRLGDFGFGSFTFTVPANTTVYSKRLDVSDSLGVFVDVTAGLDMTNRRAFWIFESIDTATGLANTVPVDLGILPINDSAIGNGEGFVTLTLQPVSSAHTGDSCFARASIVFDTEDTIKTNIWVNTIDALPPASNVSVMPGLVDPDFPVHWIGADDSLGSGVKNYDIYYSKDAAPFVLLRDQVVGDSLQFTGGESGSVYSFFSVATDNTGNREPLKANGEQSTTVRSPYASICADDNISFTFTHSVPGYTYQWQVDTTGGYFNINNSVVYGGISTNILTLTQPPTSYSGFKYRCVADGTSGLVVSPVWILRFSNTWTGTSSGAWENPSNWSCNKVPDQYTDVILPGGTNNNPVINSNTSCRSITTSPGLTLTLGAGVSLDIKGK